MIAIPFTVIDSLTIDFLGERISKGEFVEIIRTTLKQLGHEAICECFECYDEAL